jgi:hypothetical protein
LGKTAVVAKLMSADVGAGRGAEFRLFVTGLPNPSRGYVEDWLGRLEAEEKTAEAVAKTLETKRHHVNVFIGIAGIIIGILLSIAWPVARDWIN